ncbi:MAG: hypothetical protein II105_02395 [Ruminococcus sp.]|nr:hypothetical protein [Ruminococcus sp.]
MAENKAPSFFHLYLDYDEQFRMLSDAQAGMLIKALFSYANDGEEPDFDDLTVKLFFSILKKSMDREFENYQKICEQNRKNINKRYTGVYDRRQEEKEEEKENKDEEEHEEENEKENDGASFGESVLSQFNGICVRLPKVKRLTPKRLERIKEALPHLDGEGFEGLFRRVARSDFLCGCGKKGWKASFDWVMNPDNIVRVLEGEFDPAESPPSASSYDIDELEEINTLEGY